MFSDASKMSKMFMSPILSRKSHSSSAVGSPRGGRGRRSSRNEDERDLIATRCGGEFRDTGCDTFCLLKLRE